MNNELLVGDILRYSWIDGQVLEFTIVELPRTFGDSYSYKMRSTYQTGKDINSEENKSLTEEVNDQIISDENVITNSISNEVRSEVISINKYKRNE
jgi:hypothetical protein